MKTILKTIFACLLLQVVCPAVASAQALYNNPDTIQTYLKDRIDETKEQLKAYIKELAKTL